MIQHKHIIVRAEVLAPPKTDQVELTKDYFKTLVNDLGMKILVGPIGAYCDVPGNKGFTGSCIIETSHIAMHIWDETSPALLQLDVYTCGDMSIDVVMDWLKKFDPVKIEYILLDRETKLDIKKTDWFSNR